MPPDPIVLYYTFNPAAPPPERPSAWDIEVKMEDTTVKNRMTAIVQSSKESAQDLSKLDDEVGSSPCSADLVSRTATFFRFHSLRSHCTIHTQSVCFCKVLQMTRQNSSRRGWNRSHGIWRVFLEVGRARGRLSEQKTYIGVIISNSHGSKKPSQCKRERDLLPRVCSRIMCTIPSYIGCCIISLCLLSPDLQFTRDHRLEQCL